MTDELCNYKIYNWPPAEFVFNTCLLCHVFLFSGAQPPSTCRNDSDSDSRIRLSEATNSSRSLFDIDLACSHLSNAVECNRWKSCCQAADACCKAQLEKHKLGEIIFVNSESSLADPENCPQTWDGFSCFDLTTAGKTVSLQCPSFYNVASGGHGVKHCETNGSWFAKDGMPWTDYSACVPPVLSWKFAVGLSLSCLSIIALSLSLVTFRCYPQLWQRTRIKIHASLFATILLYNVATIPSDVIFIAFENQDQKVVEISQSIYWWICLAAVRFFKVASFGWMFCEGLYLLLLLRSGLKPPHRAAMFYTIGWGFPTSLIFGFYMTKLLTREFSVSGHVVDVPAYNDGGCETASSKSKYDEDNDDTWMEWWIILFPCLLTVVANFCFLFAIVRIMTEKVTTKRNSNESRRVSAASLSLSGCSRAAERQLEREGTKKAARAIFVLSPLLGTYVLFTLFQPPDRSDEQWADLRLVFLIYELIQIVADRIQGVAVSIAFCFQTHEVQSLYKQSIARRDMPIFSRRLHRRMSVERRLFLASQQAPLRGALSEPAITSPVEQTERRPIYVKKQEKIFSPPVLQSRPLDVIDENVHAEDAANAVSGDYENEVEGELATIVECHTPQEI